MLSIRHPTIPMAHIVIHCITIVGNALVRIAFGELAPQRIADEYDDVCLCRRIIKRSAHRVQHLFDACQQVFGHHLQLFDILFGAKSQSLYSYCTDLCKKKTPLKGFSILSYYK